jgi:hypothetical protein
MIDENGDIEKCFYCGEDADTKDHIIPVSFYYSGKRKGRHLTSEYGKENLISSCRECNSIAGNKVFDDVYEKKDFIQQRLKFKYKKVINLPFWSEEEIKEMGSSLRKDIRIEQLARKWVLNRIDYPNEVYSKIRLTKEMAYFLQKHF